MSVLVEPLVHVIAPPRKATGLSRRLIGGLVVLIALICSVSYCVLWFQGRPLLASISGHTQVLLGQNIALALGQRLSEIEGITQSMASIALHLPNEPEIYHQTYPAILNQLGPNSVIAGGGVWPEAFALNPNKQRDSYFWGRKDDSKLKFYDNYNAPESLGYHNQEWYAPAKLLQSTQVYWSRSYTDPYSLQAMVTCTAPIIELGVFKGVTTVDLKLSGVSEILSDLVDEDSYAFVVDRNNKFISFPAPKLVMVNRSGNSKPTPDFMYIRELAGKLPAFSIMAEALTGLDDQQFVKMKATHPNHDRYIKSLALSSDQIDEDEAKRIASHLWQQQENGAVPPVEMARFNLEQDLIFKEPVSVNVFQMPMTNWKVVTVFKQSVAEKVTNSISRQLIFSILLAVIVFGFVAYIALTRSVLSRLRHMSSQLQAAVESGDSQGVTLNYTEKDELGSLVYWYNRRSLQMEQALQIAEKANQDKTAFLAKMSHEFRTPLNSIIGFSRRLLLKLENELEPRFVSALQSIYRSALYQLDLVNDILDHSSIEEGNVTLTLSHESVNELMNSVKAKAQDLTVKEGLELHFVPLVTDIKIHCDKLKIRQVLSNLVSNAIKATRSGKVIVSAEECLFEERACIAFAVKDTGVGIPEDQQGRLFQPFTQLDNRICVPGTGLGLFLSRYYVSLHSGNIRLVSNPEVEPGCTFTIILPLSGPIGR